MDHRWPRLTEGLPGTGGQLKAVPADFGVEERPAFAPTGSGEHLWLWVEKVGRDTVEVARELARALRVDRKAVGYAGLKDRQAVTRQAFTVQTKESGLPASFSLDGVSILRTERTARRLRVGQLTGNAFRVRVRGPAAPGAAGPVLEQLLARGLPNFFGAQRFGRAGDNALRGRALLLGERPPGGADRFQRRLYLSAYQALLFNRALAERMREGLWGRALAGDVLRRADSGGLFVCQDPSADQPRVDRLEVSPTGPLFGWKLKPRPEGQVREREARLLADDGLSLDAFRAGRGETLGARRAYAVKVTDLAVSSEGADLWVTFALPRGSYATVLLAELVKGDEPAPVDPELAEED